MHLISIPTLLIFTILLILIIWGIQRYIFSRAKHFISSIIGGQVTLTPGDAFLSLSDIEGHGNNADLACQSIYASINPRALFTKGKSDFIDLYIGSIDIKYSSNERQMDLFHNSTIWQLIYRRLLLLLASLLIRKSKVTIKSFKMRFGENVIEFINTRIQYSRETKNARLKIDIGNTKITKKVPISHLNSISILLVCNERTLAFLINHLFNDFHLILPELKATYNQGKVTLMLGMINFTSSKSETYKIQVSVAPFEVTLPNLNLTTKALDIQIKDLFFKRGSIETGEIIAIRNNERFIHMPSLRYYQKTIQSSEVILKISTSMFMDYYHICMLFGLSLQLFTSYLSLQTPKLVLQLIFSDTHIVTFDIKRAYYSGNAIFAKRLSASLSLETGEYSFLSCLNPQFSIVNDSITLMTQLTEIFINTEFAIVSFLREILGIACYIEHLLEGLFDFGLQFNFEKLHVFLKANPLTNKLGTSNDSKILAMQKLQQIQEKAIQMMKAKKIERFNRDIFMNKSKEILFKMFKENITEISRDDNRVSLLCENFFASLKPLASHEENIARITSVNSEINKEDIGRCFGGDATLRVKKLCLDSIKLKEVLKIENLNVQGPLYVIKYNAKKRNDYFHFLITCDNGELPLQIPGIASRSVFVFQFKTDIQTMMTKVSSAAEELFQDFIIETDIFRRTKFNYKYLSLFDLIRLRFKGTLDIRIQKFNIGYNKKSDPFRSDPVVFFETEIQKCKIDSAGISMNVKKAELHLVSGLKYAHLATFNDFTLEFCISSDNQFKGIFIPINSYMLSIPDYDPFDAYRSKALKLTARFNFANNFLNISYEYLQALIDIVVEKTHAINAFNRIGFTHIVSKPFTEYDIFCKLPQINFSLHNGEVVFKSTGISPGITYTTDNFKISSEKFGIDLLYHGIPAMNATITDLLYSNEKSMQLDMRSLNIVSKQEFMDLYPKIKLKFPKPIGKTAINEFPNEAEMMKHFSIEKFALNIGTLDVIARLPKAHFDTSFSLNNGRIKHFEDQFGNRLNTVGFDILKIKTFTEKPAIEAKNAYFYKYITKSKTQTKLFCDNLVFRITGTDIEHPLPSVTEFIKLPTEVSRLLVIVNKITCEIITHQEPLALLVINNTNFQANIGEDGIRIVDLKVQTANLQNEKASDSFKNIFKNMNENEWILWVSQRRARQIFKFPVYEGLEIRISPFYLRISTEFLTELTSLFPIVDNIKLLDLEVDDGYEDLQSEPPELLKKLDLNSIMYWRDVTIQPFHGEVSLHKKTPDGTVKEALNRQFNYKGIQIFDYFGKQGKLLDYIRKNVKNAMLRSLPSFGRNKRKKEDPNTPVQELLQG